MMRCDDAMMVAMQQWCAQWRSMALNGAQCDAMMMRQQSKIIRHFCSGKRQQIDDSGTAAVNNSGATAAVNGSGKRQSLMILQQMR
jgi:hypothetical protein